MLAFNEKEREVNELTDKVGAQADEIEALRKQLASLKAGGGETPPPLPPAATASSVGESAALKEANARADAAESEAAAAKASATKLTAQLNAVRTRYDAPEALTQLITLTLADPTRRRGPSLSR